MAIEIEKKFKLRDGQRDLVLKRLKKLGAKFKGRYLERNYLHTGEILNQRGAFLRLRRINKQAVLTYKEKLKSDGGIKQKIEFETIVGDIAAMEAIIQRLGFKLSLVYEKKRSTFKYRGVEIVLDELPFGHYMEIEGSLEGIERVERELQIDDLKPESRGYPSLTMKYGVVNGDVFEAKFPQVR